MDNRLLLSLPDYERIFRTIHAVLINESINTSEACLYFGFFGAAILKTHHHISAKPVAGFAMYKLDSSHDVLTLATRHEEGITCSQKGFHCWVIAEEWVIDFSAPLFKEMWTTTGLSKPCQRRMFQKPITQMVASPGHLETEGDFFFHGDSDLTNKFWERFRSAPLYSDLQNICIQWYRPFPEQMPPSIGIGNSKGGISSVSLSRLKVSGEW